MGHSQPPTEWVQGFLPGGVEVKNKCLHSPIYLQGVDRANLAFLLIPQDLQSFQCTLHLSWLEYKALNRHLLITFLSNLHLACSKQRYHYDSYMTSQHTSVNTVQPGNHEQRIYTKCLRHGTSAKINAACICNSFRTQKGATTNAKALRKRERGKDRAAR